MSFTYLFYQHIMFRHSCGKCPYTNTKRPSDITIADFWGWEKTDSNINKDDKGVSLILINTDKGRRLFNVVREHMTIIPAKLENCIQPNLRYPSVFNPKWKSFEKDYENKGFEYVMKKYGDMGWRHKVGKMKGKMRRIVKKLIGK